MSLAGGVGGARFLRGLLDHCRTRDDALAEAEVTVIGNTGDDITLAGLRVCPDLDTVMYTLGGAVDDDRGWGVAGDTENAAAELARLGSGPSWFTLGDRDLATHVARSQWLGQGLTLSQVTARLTERWGLPGAGVRLIPVTDTPIETHVVLAADAVAARHHSQDAHAPEGDAAHASERDDAHASQGAENGEIAVHFQQWWVQYRAAIPAKRFVVAGLDRAVPAPGVLDAIRKADVILLPPSNPVVSLGIILGVPGVRDALTGSRAPVVGVSPIIAGAPVRGHADACLKPLGVEVSPRGVASLFEDFLDGWLVDSTDATTAPPSPGYPARIAVVHRDLLMRDRARAADLAGAALDLALDLSRRSAA